MGWLLVLWACAGDEAGEEEAADGCVAGDAPTLEIGTGDLSFSEIPAEGGRVPLVHGPQGGYHTTLALRARSLDAPEALTGRLTGWLGGEVRAEVVPYLSFRCNGAVDAQEVWNLLLVWDAQPEELDGQAVEVEAVVVDAAEREATARAQFTICDTDVCLAE